MRIDLSNGETLWVQGNSVMIGNEYDHTEGACVFLEGSEALSKGQLMDKVRKLEQELQRTVDELKVMAMTNV